MNVNVTINLWLWLLCGRAAGFKSPLLNTGIHYGTPTAPAIITEARRLLCLHDTRTDFHIFGAMAAAYDVAHILRALPPEQGTVFHPSIQHVMPDVEVTGATVRPPAGKRWASLRHFPTRIPAPTIYTVTRRGSEVLVTDDVGRDFRSAFRLAGGNTVIVTEFQSMGIDAGFLVPNWNDGDSFTVAVPPSRYPYEFAASLISSPSLVQFMAEANTLEAFVSTKDPVRKVGALACAIMREQFRHIVTELSVPVTVDPVILAESLGGVFVANQLSVDWDPIFMEGDPVTYTDAEYDPDA